MNHLEHDSLPTISDQPGTSNNEDDNDNSIDTFAEEQCANALFYFSRCHGEHTAAANAFHEI